MSVQNNPTTLNGALPRALYQDSAFQTKSSTQTNLHTVDCIAPSDSSLDNSSFELKDSSRKKTSIGSQIFKVISAPFKALFKAWKAIYIDHPIKAFNVISKAVHNIRHGDPRIQKL